ncbi:uncharacterized protein LOC127276860 [Leptopilina boulardi]|uniref:uncharacterized protein LOC127276860 n=1 Tax=Leptopilina boulardi TaxID=63433 RepID=UPI0021F5F5A9|nr:uncharacterized protein LOC127276860 [Leptopilina boulardi]XP_051153501.1 uncharacterized protein LOC127276860 [Leptopilina boulardi]XP_051153502.1 uncharacterized protein LOC127276860 [Leptopilina boulardi]XP_051153503.1 uncharacterized protein LOC127276860 [Leptopilina boulardi]XP_051153504.1 uncharacterized protein LOC127276860 [Leptopilina boulardi]XP_051153505.1 uncharacterized protein LOC127276860 [Leptopilina boulardi]
MKTFSLILLIVLVIHQTNARNLTNLLTRVNGVAEDLISLKSTFIIENIRQIIKNGSDKMEIPVLDPFTISEISKNLSSEIFKGQIDVKSVNVNNISDFKVDVFHLNLRKSKMNITLHWPMLKVNLNSYNINGELPDMADVNGTGDAELVIRNLTFSSEFSLNVDVRKRILFIDNMKSNISLTNFEVISMDVLNDEEFTEMIKESLPEQAPKYVESLQETITNLINNYIMKNVNEILSEISLKKLISHLRKLLKRNIYKINSIETNEIP